MIKIGLQSKEDRYNTVLSSLKLIEEEIKNKVNGKKRIVLKLNFVNPESELSSTHPEAVRAVLDFFKNITSQKITLVEAPFRRPVEFAFKNRGYNKLIEKYNLNYVDLNKDNVKKFTFSYPGVYQSKTINIAKTVVDSDFIISVCPPKTHDFFIATLGLKNVAVGSTVVKSNFMEEFKEKTFRRKIYHINIPEDNIFLYQVASKIYPDLNIIDGWQAMEGNGPLYGTSVNWKIAIAGLNSLAVDRFTAGMMGFDPDKIGYLNYLQRDAKINESKVEILGDDWRKFKKHFKPHDTYKEQLKWRDKSINK